MVVLAVLTDLWETLFVKLLSTRLLVALVWVML